MEDVEFTSENRDPVEQSGKIVENCGPVEHSRKTEHSTKTIEHSGATKHSGIEVKHYPLPAFTNYEQICPLIALTQGFRGLGLQQDRVSGYLLEILKLPAGPAKGGAQGSGDVALNDRHMASLISVLKYNVLQQQDIGEVLPRNVTDECQYAIVPSIDAEMQIANKLVTSDCRVVAIQIDRLKSYRTGPDGNQVLEQDRREIALQSLASPGYIFFIE